MNRYTDRSAGEDCASGDAATAPRPTRRSGHTWGVVAARGGVISSRSATGRMRVVGGAPVVTLRGSIDARWGGVVRERTIDVDTPWQSVQTAGAPTSRRP